MTQFRDLANGDQFDFVSPIPGHNSFFMRCVKTAPRKYRDESGTDHRVGRIAANVYNVIRLESLMVAAHKAGRDYARELDSSLTGAMRFCANKPLWSADQRFAFMGGYHGELSRMTGQVNPTLVQS